MSYEFSVGMKVVCVDDDSHDEWQVPGVKYRPGLDGLRRGEIYTIRSLCRHYVSGNPGMTLKEISRRDDASFRLARFRPLETKSIELFRSIAQGVTDGKPIVPDEQDEMERINAMCDDTIAMGRALLFSMGRPLI